MCLLRNSMRLFINIMRQAIVFNRLIANSMRLFRNSMCLFTNNTRLFTNINRQVTGFSCLVANSMRLLGNIMRLVTNIDRKLMSFNEPKRFLHDRFFFIVPYTANIAHHQCRRIHYQS